MKKNDHVKAQVLSESERLGRSETDIQALKEALGKLEVEKEAGVLQYEQTLERLSKLESEVSQAKENSKGLNERASKAEAEVQSLKETLAKVEAEREASLLQYQQCLDRISNLETQLNDRACKAEKETELLKEELTRLKAEKETLLAKYMQALEKIANLETKLLLAEDYASRTSDRADRAEKEVETLRETVARLNEEKETAVLNYEQCSGKIAVLECEIIIFQEEAERLKAGVQDGAAKLKGSEEQCLLLESELDTFEQKVAKQSQELSDKQKELGRLWACVQEERMCFMEAETTFQSLQNLHSKVQEELRSVASVLQKKVQLLKNREIQNQHLEDEVKKAKNENKGLNDLNLTCLSLLHLAYVDISSAVPAILSNITSLKAINLHGCSLYGILPTSVLQLPKLEDVDLSYNRNLGGYLPEFQSDNPLRTIDLSSTAFSGELPASIGNLGFLNELILWNCDFVGSIPSSVGNLMKLMSLALGDNIFGGNMPSSIANLTQLTGLCLSNLDVDPGKLSSWLLKLKET